MERDDLDLRTVFLTGKGRSGTTWLASILATHERCVYKHEPFLAAGPTPFRSLLERLPTEDAPILRDLCRTACRDCDARVEEPFVQQIGMRRLAPEPLALVRRAALRHRWLAPVYRALGRPRFDAGDGVLIKDVNFPNELLPRLCEVVRPKLVAVVRNPFANVSSLLMGRELGAFRRKPSADDVVRVRLLLERPELAHLRRYRAVLADLPITAFEALRWRVQTEPLVDFATRRPDDARLVVYERFCADPIAGAEALFDFAGWRMLQPTRDFIEASIEGPRRGLDARRAYFSVFRRPEESLHKWKALLSLEQQGEIASVVRDSPLMGLWPDLALAA